MNREQLKEHLADLGVDTCAFSLPGGLPNEKYVLDQEANGQWAVYYGERGQKSGLQRFDSEGSACKFFLGTLVRDQSAKRK